MSLFREWYRKKYGGINAGKKRMNRMKNLRLEARCAKNVSNPCRIRRWAARPLLCRRREGGWVGAGDGRA